MTLLEARRKIIELGQPVVDTVDIAALLQIDRNRASKVLTRLGDNGEVIRLRRGKWVVPQGTRNKIDRLEVPEGLAAPSPSYISLQTALFYHGLISQIPEVTYAVTTGKARRYETPLGVFSLHHIEPDFFFGFESKGSRWLKMATQEKAVVDFLYLSQARSRLFAALPEIELLKSFRLRVAREMIDRIPFRSRRAHVRNRFEDFVAARS